MVFMTAWSERRTVIELKEVWIKGQLFYGKEKILGNINLERERERERERESNIYIYIYNVMV